MPAGLLFLSRPLSCLDFLSSLLPQSHSPSPVEITDREWEAIQAGAISENKLIQILNNTNIDTIRQRATPRATNSLSTAKQHRISAMCASGYTTSEIADAFCFTFPILDASFL